jgi:hypothetical protein
MTNPTEDDLEAALREVFEMADPDWLELKMESLRAPFCNSGLTPARSSYSMRIERGS